MNLNDLEPIVFYLTVAGYFMAMLFYVLYLPFPKSSLAALAGYTTGLGFAANTGAIVLRMVIARRPPLANGYEFILTFAWGIVVIFLLLLRRYRLSLIGALVLPVAFFLLAFVVFFMSADERVTTAIQPALKSNWLTFHVVTAMLGYGALAASFALGILYLIKQKATSAQAAGRHESKISSRIPDLSKLDFMSYRMVMFGFPLLTLCIITGAIWANYAWGTYWSWDPKETWSLITWIIYAIFLHARLMYGWRGKRSAWLAVIGFLAVLFTFFGVNYFLPGLHSYA